MRVISLCVVARVTTVNYSILPRSFPLHGVYRHHRRRRHGSTTATLRHYPRRRLRRGSFCLFLFSRHGARTLAYTLWRHELVAFTRACAARALVFVPGKSSHVIGRQPGSCAPFNLKARTVFSSVFSDCTLAYALQQQTGAADRSSSGGGSGDRSAFFLCIFASQATTAANARVYEERVLERERAT